MTGERMGGDGAVLERELELARDLDPSTKTVVLVEGESDRRALGALARRVGWNLEEDGTAVIAITGATNVDRFLLLLPTDLAIVGMCDDREETAFREAFRVAGVGDAVFACHIDLEDELIRALGVERMLEIAEEQGELRAFRSFQNQPDQRQKTVEQQLWRWLGNRKIRYATVMVEALDLDEVPRPLAQVIAAATDASGGRPHRKGQRHTLS